MELKSACLEKLRESMENMLLGIGIRQGWPDIRTSRLALQGANELRTML